MASPPSSSHLPLNPRVFEILFALVDGPAHGYQIKKSVEARTRNAVTLDAGSLYRAVARLLDDGWITETDERPDPDDHDPRRRYYRLTESGREILTAEARRLAHLVDLARDRRLIPDPGGTR